MPQGELQEKEAPDIALREPITAYVALGANLGDASAALRRAVQAIGKLPRTTMCRLSGFYKTAPLDTDSASDTEAPGSDDLNAVAAIETGLTAPALLNALQAIELQAGRERPYRNAPRTLDLDLLLYGSACIDSARLTVPHPRMMQRAFVLVPLAEIAPDLVSGSALNAVRHQLVKRLGNLTI